VSRAEAAWEERPSLAAADVYAWALYRAGRFSEAREYASQALHTGTREPLYLFHAGMIAAALGDQANAQKLLSEALALNPWFHPVHAGEARQQLRLLEGKR
jgi:Flp pilus assembly protein TadD